jgi:hypothetical protein
MVVSPTIGPFDATVNRSVADGWGKWGHGHGVVPLYRSPTLTDEERALLERVRGGMLLLATLSTQHSEGSFMADAAGIGAILERTK